jgi:3-methylcrotonyl-CoA carboxylase alpha subunit
MMLCTVLIANRGEIACRIMRSVRALGMNSVAIYSDADRDAAHVRAADRAVHIGPAAPRDSYLNIARIMQAAHDSGADAIHPGYGFLSENPALATACADQGIAFVGPPAAAMQAMGSKRAAKLTMQALGVPVLPGYHGELQTLVELEAEALRIGLPLMIKPSGGGGGKGMQVVSDASQLRAALQSAQRLASSAFGDAALLLERYLPGPRHIEVQVLADKHGHILTLGDRDCSVQRRHQKLLEEAPAPGLADAVRQAMQAAAITAARAVGYINAGTVEFLYQDGEFWFMEMNTRLQVEHPVTELITGIDLVEWQLRIAAGEPLALLQADIHTRGHAVEVRVCAEDTQHGFTPSAGKLLRCDWPDSITDIRVDAGFAAGDHVPSDYDSLLGKIIAIAADRDSAIRKLDRALQHTRIAGVNTNLGWLQCVLRNEAFIQGQVSTQFVIEHAATLQQADALSASLWVLAALAVLHDSADDAERSSPWSARDAFRPGLPALQSLQFRNGEAVITVTLERRNDTWHGTVNAEVFAVTWTAQHHHQASVIVNGLQQLFHWLLHDNRLYCWLNGRDYQLQFIDPRQLTSNSTAQPGALISSLPGTVVQLDIHIGDTVAAGAVLMVIEAMKMEHAIVAPHAGTVTHVHCKLGGKVAAGVPLLDLERV